MLRHLLVSVVVCACAVVSAAPTSSQDDLRVLFIGNSLTAMHDVPGLVERLTVDGTPRVRSTSVTRNDFSLDDHWQDGEALRAINRGGWSVVVMQQGPSALPESRVLLRAAAKRFATEIRRVGAKPALYMVWPAEARAGDFDNVRISYQTAATDVEGLFIPAGEAWRAAWRREPDLALYASDRFHASPQGAYLAALTIAQAITGRRATTMPTLGQRNAEMLQSVVEEMINMKGREEP
jgi:hypothetical protein